MTPTHTYWMWSVGTHDVTVTIGLDWRKRYLITGFLTLTEGDDYAHVYISTVCRYSGGDQVLCGIRDDAGDFGLGVTEFISSASRVTIKLRTKGGSHRAEGAVYEY
ncbi:MAG TPA: hypothetical protein PKA95_12490 [Thermomicrobiales bacterium]|nr:hypothetical protein [Thermomicrobiales bacterium]